MTAATPVPLPRFWCPSGDGYALDGSGYLADPITAAWATSHATAIPTEELAAHRALVLLGEPGIGKTTVMRTHRHLLSGAGRVPDVVAPELDAFGSEERLIRDVFDSPRVRRWLAGDTELCLLLDGVDELAARLPSFPALAAEYLRGWPAERLLLRLSCRTAGWPSRLDAAVRGLYGNDAAVVELLPLRRDDVRSLVGDVVDGEAFLSEVDRRGVAPFAARPLTARMLAKEFARTGSLPDRAADIYRTALLALCDDDHERVGQGSAGSPSDRLAAARRIAAVTVFGSRPTVWPGSLVDREPQDTSVDDCCGDAEPSNGGSVAMTGPLVRAALSTALFTGRGGGRLGWAHATFADYLSAQWLLANELTRPQLRSLLLADDGRLYPQVRGTAAWAVASDPAGTGWLVRCDPEAFAGSLDLPDAGLRAEVVEGLLELAAAGALRRDWRTGYGNLAHPRLADQVRRALASDSPDVRRLAVDLASHCSLRDVRAELVSIALDPGHLPAHERSSAALAALHMSEAEPVGDGDLLPLVHDPAIRGEDPDDELLGAALLASWPHAVGNAEVLRHVRPPQRRNLFGSYALFVGRLAQALTADDLPAALDWLQRTGDAAAGHHLAPLTNAALRLSFDRLDDPPTLHAVARYAHERASAYQPLLGDDVSGDGHATPDAARRRLALTILEATDGDEAVLAVTSPGNGPALLNDDDFLWLVGKYADAEPATRTALARVAGWLFRTDLRDHVDAVLGLPADHPLRQDVTGAWTEPVRLDSPQAVAGREQWGSIRERRERRRPAADTPPVDDWIAAHLDAVEAGDTARFWLAARLVTVPPGTSWYRDEHQPDLTAHPRWPSMPASVRERFLQAAVRYVRDGECDPDRWLGQDLRYFPAEAGYRALVLLLRLAPEELPRVPQDAWERWAPILVSWTCAGNGASWEDKGSLLRHALPHAGPQLRDALRSVVGASVRNGTHVFARAETALLWDDSFADWVVAALANDPPDPTRSDLMDLLAAHDVDRARPVLRRWLDPIAVNANPERATAAVRTLLWHDARRSWPLVRQRLDELPGFGAEALMASADTATRRVPDLDEQSLAELYRVLAERFPPATDPQYDDAHWVGPRETAGRWRDAVLEALQDAGTEAAVQALRGLAQSSPEQRRLRLVVAEAEDRARTARWSPKPPGHLRRLARENEARLVDRPPSFSPSSSTRSETSSADCRGRHRMRTCCGTRPPADPSARTRSRPTSPTSCGTGSAGGRSLSTARSRSGPPAPQGSASASTCSSPRQRPRPPATTRRSRSASSLRSKPPGTATSSRPSGHSSSTRYMADLGTQHGVYIAAWFDLAWWSTDDSARARAARWPSRAALQERLDDAAAAVRAHGVEVACVTLDCSYERPRP